MSDAEPRFPRAPEPEPPSLEDIESMRGHRRDDHGEDFDLRRDVSFAGNVSAAAPLTYIAPTPAARAAFKCRDCPGRSFMLRDSYIGTPERRAHLRLVDRDLRTLLAGVAPEEQDDFIDAYERRRLAAWLGGPTSARLPTQPTRPTSATAGQQDQATTSAGAARKAARRRPITARRIERRQRFLLQRRAAGRTINEAIDDLIDLHETNRKLYIEIVGDGTLYAANTFNDYYKQLTTETKAAAKRKCAELRGSGEAKPKRGKFTG